jgi:hypothetical protein
MQSLAVQDGVQQLYISAGASVLRYNPVSGAASAAHSRWPTRTLLALGLSQNASPCSVVACGEVVPELEKLHHQYHNRNHCTEPPAVPANPQPTEGHASHAAAAESDANEWGVFYSHSSHETPLGNVAGRRRGRLRRRPGGSRIEGLRGGGVLGGNLPDAVGRAPLELWDYDDFQDCEE